MILLVRRALLGDVSDEATAFNGLETGSTTRLQVLIERLSEDENKIGLTRERVEARVNQSLRKAGITPIPLRPEEGFKVSEELGLDHLYVNINATDSGSYSLSIEFQRRVFYQCRGQWFTRIGTTWNRGGVGMAGDADYILGRIADNVEVFCNEFLKANGK
jgi:hypothetical protein